MNEKMRATRVRARQHGVIFIGSKFDDCPIADAIGVIGKQHYHDLLTQAGANGWSQERIDSEIRCLADEIASTEVSE